MTGVMPVSVPKKSAHTYAPAHFSVGADALIGPADCSVFTKIFGEFVTFQRADEGIGPYKFYRRFPKGGQESSAPAQALKLPHKNAEITVF